MRAAFAAAAFCIFMGGCEQSPAPEDPGAAYVRLALALDKATDGGYVFAFHGDEAAREAAAQGEVSVDDIAEKASALIADIDDRDARGVEAERLSALRFRLSAMLARIDVLRGETTDFAQEAHRIFGVRPPRYSVKEADAALEKADQILAGEGTLAERVLAFEAGMKVPADKREEVFRAAIEACRARTAEHIDLPPGESIELVFVDSLPAAGRYDYLGDYRGRITVNRQADSIGAALYLGCHEGYPGHHLRAILMEERYGARDWPEFEIETLFEPASLFSEGLGQYAVDLAFPGDERIRVLRDELFPLAGLDPRQAEQYVAFNRAMNGAAPYATIEIARMYIDKEIDREMAIDLITQYSLRPREEMAGMFGFVDLFRTFVVTYSLGEEMVRTRIESAAHTPSERWRAFEALNAALVTPALLEGDSE